MTLAELERVTLACAYIAARAMEAKYTVDKSGFYPAIATLTGTLVQEVLLTQRQTGEWPEGLFPEKGEAGQ